MLDVGGEFFFLRLVVGAIVFLWRFWCYPWVWRFHRLSFSLVLDPHLFRSV